MVKCLVTAISVFRSPRVQDSSPVVTESVEGQVDSRCLTGNLIPEAESAEFVALPVESGAEVEQQVTAVEGVAVLDVIQENEIEDGVEVVEDLPPCRVTVVESTEAQGKPPPSLGVFHRWDTVKLVEVGTQKLNKQNSHQRSSSGNSEIASERSQKVPMHSGSGSCSSWNSCR